VIQKDTPILAYPFIVRPFFSRPLVVGLDRWETTLKDIGNQEDSVADIGAAVTIESPQIE
jgi:hypothetical protein